MGAASSTSRVSSESRTRERILDEAESLFAQRGYNGVGLREVATAVGLSKSSLFHHFRGKPELYNAVCTRILLDIEGTLDAVEPGESDAWLRLEAWIDALVDLMAVHTNYARVLLRSVFEDDDISDQAPDGLEVDRVLARILVRVDGFLKDGMAAGRFRAADRQHLLLTMIGQIVFPFATGEFGTQVLGMNVFEPAQVARRKKEVLDLIRYGLLAPTGAGND